MLVPVVVVDGVHAACGPAGSLGAPVVVEAVRACVEEAADGAVRQLLPILPCERGVDEAEGLGRLGSGAGGDKDDGWERETRRKKERGEKKM